MDDPLKIIEYQDDVKKHGHSNCLRILPPIIWLLGEDNTKKLRHIKIIEYPKKIVFEVER